MARAPQTERLEVLVGRWNSAGRTVPGPSEPAIRITGTDTYECEWLAGGFFPVHRVDVRMGDEKVEVIELIGPYDPFGFELPDAVLRQPGQLRHDDGARARRRWERLDDGTSWRHWMDMWFTRTS